MSETLLKKEFKESDVQRIRNLVSGNYGNATTVQVGYSKKTVDHVEGDVWEDNGKMWTIKDGIKQTYTKLHGIKSLLRIPLSCPECFKPMKLDLDKKMYPIHGKCFDCVIVYESKLKREGKYEEYVKNMINGNILTHLQEAEQFIEAYVNESEDVVITQDGDEEVWVGTADKGKMLDLWKKEIAEMKEAINN